MEKFIKFNVWEHIDSKEVLDEYVGLAIEQAVEDMKCCGNCLYFHPKFSESECGKKEMDIYRHPFYVSGKPVCKYWVYDEVEKNEREIK